MFKDHDGVMALGTLPPQMPVAEKTTLGASTLHVFGAFFVLIINLDAVLIKIGYASIRAGEKFQLPIVLKSGH
jgi:hypothetical protein